MCNRDLFRVIGSGVEPELQLFALAEPDLESLCNMVPVPDPAGFRIRIDLMRIRIRIRIQHFFQLRIRIPDPDPGFDDLKLKKIHN